MTDTEIKEIDDRIAKLRSSRERLRMRTLRQRRGICRNGELGHRF